MTELATYEEAKERIERLNASEFNALCLAAMFGGNGLRPTRFKRLVALGLVEPYEDKVLGQGRTPIDRIPLTVTRYRVPFPVHIAWVESCAE